MKLDNAMNAILRSSTEHNSVFLVVKIPFKICIEVLIIRQNVVNIEGIHSMSQNIVQQWYMLL